MILDTNALSALMDGDSALEGVLRESAELKLTPFLLENIDLASWGRATGWNTKHSFRESKLILKF